MRRGAFTLIELLVAVSIVAVLLALSVAATMRVRAKVVEVQVRSDLMMVGLASGMFTQTYGEPPMVAGGGPNGAFRLCSSYTAADGSVLPWPEVRFLAYVFPDVSFTDNGLRVSGAPVSPTAPVMLDGNRALMLWLCGGKELNYAGFSNNPKQPFTAPTAGENRRRYLVPPAGGTTDRATGQDDGVLRDRWGTPYVVFGPVKGVGYTGANTFGVAPYLTPQGLPLNPRAVQVVSAGADGKFAPGGVYVPGSGAWAGSATGADDFATFAEKRLGVVP